MTLSAWARDDELLGPGRSLGGVSNLMKIKGTSPRSFGKNIVGMILLLLLLLFLFVCCCFLFLFRYDFSVALTSSLARFEMRQFKTNCSGLKTGWESPKGMQQFTECVLRHYILFFYTRFVDSACKQLTMASSQARILIM